MDVVNEGKEIAQSEDQRIHEFCDRWGQWHRSRRLFAPPTPKHLLVRLQNLPAGDPPDAELSASSSYFNLALLAMPEGRPKEAFYLYYLHRVRPVKILADHFGITSQGFYKMLKTFRTDAHRAYHRMLTGNL
jgi:hypothetical protein